MPKFHAVGIDLGTTFSVVARLDETGKTQIIRNSYGDILTPSVVLFDDREVVVGKDAKKAAADQAERVAECVKRDMGSKFYSRPIRGEKLPPEVIQACILRHLAADALRACGPNIKVVITVPAYFDEPRRKATADAGEMAGLNVLDIVNEPTAAALSFGEHLGYLDPQGSPKGNMKVLVYDLGGGTFDVTVIEIQPGHVRTMATDGDVRLGGRDWDQRLLDYLADKFQSQHGMDPRHEPACYARLWQTVEEAKHTLSARAAANVHLDCGGKSADVTIDRETFEQLTEDLLERTAFTSQQVLQAAGTSWQYISHILLVGGSTRMPMVARMLERISGGMKGEHIVNPDEAVARGAAIYAGYLLASYPITQNLPDAEPQESQPTFRVTDVNAHSLGIEGIDPQTLRKENIILISRNTPLPCKVQEKFVTKKASQQSVAVRVLEGESKSPDQCTHIARAALRNLPEGLPQGYPINVSYEYGANGRLHVRATLPGTSKEVEIELERERAMDNSRVARWKMVFSTDEGFGAFAAVLAEVLEIEAVGDDAIELPALRPEQVSSRASLRSSQGVPNESAIVDPFSFSEISRCTDDRSKSGVIINIIGHLTASIVGLVIGYYVLCWIQPTANFLELNLPGLPPPVQSRPNGPS